VFLAKLQKRQSPKIGEILDNLQYFLIGLALYYLILGLFLRGKYDEKKLF
jgi:hypothetical protein